MKTLLESLLEEHSDLNEKVFKIEALIRSDVFKDFSDEKKDLLNAQYHSMQSYLYILACRIELEQNKIF